MIYKPVHEFARPSPFTHSGNIVFGRRFVDASDEGDERGTKNRFVVLALQQREARSLNWFLRLREPKVLGNLHFRPSFDGMRGSEQ
jgi:hypothetical protein